MRKLFLFIAMLWIIITTTICFVIAMILVPLHGLWLLAAIFFNEVANWFTIKRIKYKSLNNLNSVQ